MSVDNLLETYLIETESDEPTVRLVKSHSSPTIEMQAEALTMCREILTSVPEPVDSTEKLLWRQAIEALQSCKKEIVANDVDAEWKPAPAPSRSRQQSRTITKNGFKVERK